MEKYFFIALLKTSQNFVKKVKGMTNDWQSMTKYDDHWSEIVVYLYYPSRHDVVRNIFNELVKVPVDFTRIDQKMLWAIFF